MVERSKVWVPGTRRRKTGRVKGSTTAERRDQNARAAAKVLNRLLVCNFSARDIFLTLKYDDDHLPTDPEQVHRDGENFLRRLVRAMEKAGADKNAIRRVMVCADKDPETQEGRRYHLHIVITGWEMSFRAAQWYCGEKALNEIWGRGSVYAEPMRQQEDYTALAVYLIRQAIGGENRKKYYPSRNLRKPVVTETLAATGGELRVPKGANVREKRYDALQGVNYVRYILPEKRPGSRHPEEGGGPDGL